MNEEINMIRELIDDLRLNGLSTGTSGTLGYHSGAKDIIADLLEKHIPRKPVKAYCPNCKRHLRCPKQYISHMNKVKNRIGDNYCPRCGQALDWSEYEVKEEKE